MYDTIVTDLSENIFTITINRPDKLNALNTQMIHDLIAAFEEAEADDAVRAIIVTGAGRGAGGGAGDGGGGGGGGVGRGRGSAAGAQALRPPRAPGSPAGSGRAG